MRRILLLDLSNNNRSAVLRQVRASGITGFWHKVSEGQSFMDRYWVKRREEGRRLGLRVGGYHFASPNSPADATSEARYFASMLGPVGRKDLCPVLDLEITGGLSGARLEAWARLFNHEFHHKTGIWPLFYSYPSFIEELHASRVIGRGLWLASYGRNDGAEHPYRVPAPFRKALAHQFTSSARIPGVEGRCDLSSAPKLYPLLARGLRGI